MSETKGPFDAALNVLTFYLRPKKEWGPIPLQTYTDKQLSIPEKQRLLQVRSALRVLEAAGKVDKEDVLGEFDNLVASCHEGFVPTDPEFKPCFEDGCVEGINMVRKILEALPVGEKL